jgi:hypothetical protein
MEDYKRNEREEVFSKAVKAGKRTYFFDVKTTRSDDYFLTITESKKKIGDDGNPFYAKHKIFLYKEDFEKFQEGLSEVVKFVVDNRGTEPIRNTNHTPEGSQFTDVSFDDLGSENNTGEKEDKTSL